MIDEAMLVVIAVIVVTVIVLAIMSTGLFIIKSNEQGLFFRMGHFVKVLPPGLNFVPPLVSEVKRVDTSLQSLSASFDDLLSNDGKRFALKMMVHYRVVDPKKAVLETPSYVEVVKEVAGNSVRVAARKVDRDNFWTNSNQIREDLGTEIGKTVSMYGIAVSTVELTP
jgi:regulator of protease activity HflC (stomatin/prohibitin superfamily)